MADISKVILPDNSEYDIKDATARSGLSDKQDTLVSGTNIKTINNTTILGSGNIDTTELPSQTSNSGKFLTTNGSAVSWASVPQTYTDTITTTTTWSGSDPYTQTVTLANYTATSNTKVDIQPTAAQIAQLITDEVTSLLISNTSGTLTMYATGAAPTTAMTLQVTCTEVTSA